MARVDREGFHFFEVSCDCVTERGTTRFHVSFGKGENEKNEMERLYVSARQVILISAKVVATICSSSSSRFRDTQSNIYSSCSILRLFVPSYVFFNYFDRLVSLAG